MSTQPTDPFEILPLPKLTPVRQAALLKLNIHSVNDCLLHFPLRYEDRETVYPIAGGIGKSIRVMVDILSVARIKKRKTEMQVLCADESATLTLRFIRVFPGQYQQFADLQNSDDKVHLFGDIRMNAKGQLEMFHPKILPKTPASFEGSLSPVYPICQGITQAYLATLIRKALDTCDLSDTLPESLIAPYGLMNWRDAIVDIHYPSDGRMDPEKAWQRIRFDELLAQQLLLQKMRLGEKQARAPVCEDKAGKIEQLMAVLPFTLTDAQQRVWQEISADLLQIIPMRRLLQGDVGSGKTVIAALAVCQAVSAGFQAAVMAPTDILATQHANTLAQWLQNIGISCALITSNIDRQSARHIKEGLASGKINCVIGTHALFYESVDFDRLGVVVIDEQHRFGVKQRHKLCKKGEAPHQLLMSATPIPRTLAMTYLADADLSIIDSLPPGRKPVTTKLIHAARRDRVIDSVYLACQQKQQVYWVCPLIEESETLALQAVDMISEQIRKKYPDLRLATVTGRVKGSEKQRIMQDFRAGNLDVLVATTVIEVGVDVPTANIMIIESAERFGLAQLHQLRGRVGRGSDEASCILLYQKPLSDTARERLKILYETSDGFEVARRDMQLRGIGDYYGIRQSGIPLLRFAEPMRDADLIEQAACVAKTLLNEDNPRINDHLKRYHYFTDPTLTL